MAALAKFMLRGLCTVFQLHKAARPVGGYSGFDFFTWYRFCLQF